MIKNPLLDALTNGHDHLPGSIYRQELFRAGHILRIVDTRDQLVDLPHTPLSTWPRALCIAGGAPGNFRQCMRPSASVWPCKKTKQTKQANTADWYIHKTPDTSISYLEKCQHIHNNSSTILYWIPILVKCTSDTRRMPMRWVERGAIDTWYALLGMLVLPNGQVLFKPQFVFDQVTCIIIIVV